MEYTDIKNKTLNPRWKWALTYLSLMTAAYLCILVLTSCTPERIEKRKAVSSELTERISTYCNSVEGSVARRTALVALALYTRTEVSDGICELIVQE